MGDHDDLLEPWGLSSRKDRECSDAYRGIAPDSAAGFRSPVQAPSRDAQRQADAGRWAESTAKLLLQARSVPELLWATTTLREERSFAFGATYGLASTAADVVIGPFELARMFVLAELYESVDGPWRRAIRSARALPGPLGMVAYKAVLGDDFAPIERMLRTYYDERERFIEQIEKIIQHPIRFIEDLPEAMWKAFKSKWERYQTLRGQHDLESQYQAGKEFGELVGEVLMALMVVRQVARLAKEIPDVFKHVERARTGKAGSPGEKAVGAGAGGELSASGSKVAEKVDTPTAEVKTQPAQGPRPLSPPGGEGGPTPNPPPAAEPGPKPNPPPGAPPPGATDGPEVPREQMTCTADPVDVASGMVLTEKVDLELPGLLGFHWERVWYSTSTYAGPLGYGWHHSYDEALQVERDGARYRTSDGRTVKFPLLADGEEHFDPRQRITLRRDVGGYSVRMRDQHVHRFAADRSNRFLHRLCAIEHPAGRRLQLQYDDAGWLREIVDGAGRAITFGHDTDGRIISISVPDPELAEQRVVAVRYGYDALGNLSQVGDATGSEAGYRYLQHQLVQHKNRNGLAFNFEYDGAGRTARCIRTWGDDGIYAHKLTYDVAGDITVVENSLGEKTLYQHRGGLVIRSVDPRGATTLTEYDAFNQKREETDALGQRTRFVYDERGNLERVVRPDGGELHAVFDANNRVRSVQDGPGAPWAFDYDRQGNLVERTDPLGSKTRYRYEAAMLAEITDAGGQQYRLAYDEQGNLSAVHAPDGSLRQWTHDALGRVRTASDPQGNAQQITRDVLGRVTTVHEPDGNVRHFTYDAEGSIVRFKDKHRDVELTYAGLGRLASRREGGTTVFFEYDTEERLRAVHNEHGRAYRFERGESGQIEAEYGFDRLRRSYRRDLLGRVTEFQRASGVTSRYAYDEMGRLLEVQHSDGGFERYAYAADGGLTRADNRSCQLQFERDALGRVVRARQDQHWVQSDYDVLGRRVRVRSSLGVDQRIQRDSMGRLQAVDAGAFQAQITRDMFGLEIERALPGGVRSRWQRDPLGRPIRHEIHAQDQTRRASTYSWDADVRLLQLVDSEHGLVRYGYDARARLNWARYIDGTAELRMPDAVSNLYRSEDRKDRVYGTTGELLESTDRSGRVTRYEYDPDGNLVEKLESGNAGREQRWQYRWNVVGQLVTVTRPDGSQVEFRYDALGRRIQKRYRGQITHFVWDGDVPLHEWVEGELEQVGEEALRAAATSDYLIKKREAELQAHLAQGPPDRGTSTAPITWLFEPDSFVPMAKLMRSQSQAIVTDHVGTPKAMLDGAGNLTWSVLINTYGDLHRVKGSRLACPFRWQGQYEDAETGLYYNRFRYYDPQNGQYVSRDPIGLAGGIALYAYCPDPLGWVDPRGLCGSAAESKAISDEVDAAFDSGQVRSGTYVRAPANQLSGSGPKEGQGDIWYHDNVKVGGAGPNGETVNVRTHSPNPNAPPGSLSSGSYTTQVNTNNGRYLLPDGSWKTMGDMTPAERAAAHYPAE